MKQIHVTRHAQRRYLERIAGVDFSAFDRRRISDGAAVTAVLAEARIAPDFVWTIIATEVEPLVPATARNRGSRCIVRGVTARYVVEGGNAVTTVLPLHG